MVTGITNNGATVPWYEFSCEFPTTFQEQLNRADQGGVFPQSLSLIFPQLSTDKRISLEQLINDRVAVICKTMGSGYWLLGQEFGLKVAEYSASPGARGGANAYRVVFESVGREQFRKTDDSFLENVAVNGGSNVPVTPIKNIAPGGAPVTDVLSSWGVTSLYKFGAFPIIEITD
jgi:hypothetical protein